MIRAYDQSFFGLVISMYHDDHAPPHFHVKYAEYRGRITIGGLEVMDGDLPAGLWRWCWSGPPFIELISG